MYNRRQQSQWLRQVWVDSAFALPGSAHPVKRAGRGDVISDLRLGLPFRRWIARNAVARFRV